ncbi:MAG: MBL fold metallo-hydrolase [Flavobacteriales bacterium]|jgi:glyoxylase-like metal-dependent hydrolase (beta-lactamase superfamily II)|nr:MBL fold metallo-hydrolase [Flavobacteriales bacterium]
MKLSVINTGFFKLDGGAMFGVVPKKLWSKTNPPDANNLCSWAMRSLLIEDGNRLILIDTGIGNKQDDKFFSHYHLHGDDSLEKSLKRSGYSKSDVTDVILTHLHFDHCGGAVSWKTKEQKILEPTFKNANYWSNEAHWNWATNPNVREKASFLKNNIIPIEQSGQLKFIKKRGVISNDIFPNIDIYFADGHTESQMIPIINYNGQKIAFMADLLPSVGHIPIPYVMGYDTRPLLTLNEKIHFLNLAFENNFLLFLQHDSVNECCKLKDTEKGIRLDTVHNLNDFF